MPVDLNMFPVGKLDPFSPRTKEEIFRPRLRLSVGALSAEVVLVGVVAPLVDCIRLT